MLNKNLTSFPGKMASLLVMFIIAAFIVVGCGKKDDKTTTSDKKTDTKTETKKDTGSTGNKSAGNKKEIKKSDAPKKDVTEKAPEGWTELTTSDEKVMFSLPSKWTIEEHNANRFSTLSEDKTMGTVLVTFPNDKISSEDLLESALGDFDFDPDGEANAIQVGNVEGYITAARGTVGGQDMMMYIMSAIESDGSGNYIIYVYTPTDQFQKNSATMEKILYSINFK